MGGKVLFGAFAFYPGKPDLDRYCIKVIKKKTLKSTATTYLKDF